MIGEINRRRNDNSLQPGFKIRGQTLLTTRQSRSRLQFEQLNLILIQFRGTGWLDEDIMSEIRKQPLLFPNLPMNSVS
jgi:hypothetical protein